MDSADNIFITGSAEGIETLHNYITIKYAPDGTLLWSAVYNGPANGIDKATSIAIDAAGDVYITGRSEGISSGYDYATIKYDGSDGHEIWTARYNRSDKADWGEDLALDSSNNVYVTGHSVDSGDPDEDYATVKYDSDGVQLWAKRYNGPDNDCDRACAIAVDALGNAYVTGESFATGADFDYLTIKYDTNGTELWIKRSDGGYDDTPMAMALDNYGNAYVTGETETDTNGYNYLTIKYDTADGNDSWGYIYNGNANANDTSTAIALDSEGDVYITGSSENPDTDMDYVTIKYNQYCINSVPEDLNNDCIVDMEDVRILTESWLEDNYI